MRPTFPFSLGISAPARGSLVVRAAFLRKLFWLALAWIRGPSTERCSLESKPFLLASAITLPFTRTFITLIRRSR